MDSENIDLLKCFCIVHAGSSCNHCYVPYHSTNPALISPVWLVENREHFDLTAFCDKKIKNMLTSCFTCGIIYRHSMEMGL